MKFREMTVAEKGMNPLQFGSGPANTRFRVDPELRIRMPDHFFG